MLVSFKESERVGILLLGFHAETDGSLNFLPRNQETPRLEIKESF